MAPRISVMVQDRSALFRSALGLVLSAAPVASVGISAQVATCEELLARAFDAPPDTIFLEISSTPWDVLPVLAQLSTLASPVRVVGVGRSTERVQLRFLDGPPLSRNASSEDFLRAAGLPSAASESPDLADFAIDDDAHPLTRAEQRVLSLLSAGWTTAQIAERLQLSPRAIRGARERVLTKLDAQSGAQAVAAGIRRGLLSPGGKS